MIFKPVVITKLNDFGYVLQLKGKRQAIVDKSTERKLKIGNSSQYQNFVREVEETKAWLTEKLKIATDESYRVCFLFMTF